MAQSILNVPPVMTHNYLQDTDLNNVKDAGFYFIRENVTNTPGTYAHLCVIASLDIGTVEQVWFNDSTIKTRRYMAYNNTWSAWYDCTTQPQIQRGHYTTSTTISANSTQAITINFPSAFSSTPTVVVSVVNNTGYQDRVLMVNALTYNTTSFTVTLRNLSSTDRTLSGSNYIDWVAVTRNDP